MVWRLASVALVIAGLGGAASANGRPPATSSIAFRQGHESDIVVGLTFGLVVSHDGGATWGWMCEDAIGYSGTYDPSYEYSATGGVFATTFKGLKVMRDSCTFSTPPSVATFASAATLGPAPENALYYTAVQSADATHPIADFHIYKSVDDGMTFPVVASAAAATETNVWWQSIVVAPSDPLRVYLSGYRYPPGIDTVRDHLLFRSDDGGATWQQLATTGFTPLMPNSVLHIAGIWANNPDHVYVRVERYDNTLSDAIYVSSNKGATWKPIETKPTTIGAFVARAAVNSLGNHDLVLGTRELGAEISHDDGANWEPLAGAPHMGCLVENAAGELWACTQNFGFSAVQPDDAGVMKTSDLVTWTKVLRYQDLTEAASCAAGTIQHDTCAPLWCAVCAQLGCTPSASYGCPVVIDGCPVPTDGCPVPTDASIPRTTSGKGGCCDSGASSGGPLALALSVATMLRRPRRRARCRRRPRQEP